MIIKQELIDIVNAIENDNYSPSIALLSVCLCPTGALT